MFSTVREVAVLVGTIVGVIATATTLIIKLAKRTKQWVKERDWNKIAEQLPKLIIEAEKFTHYAGLEKKEYVKTRLAVFAIKNKIVFDEVKFDTQIDDIVKFTKAVNQRTRDIDTSQLVVGQVNDQYPQPSASNY